MGRPSNRTERRREIARAMERVLSTHGLGGATVAAVADEAGCAPGLVHHHFEDREDLMRELVRSLLGRFRAQLPSSGAPSTFVEVYVDAALALNPARGRTAARAWVGLFAEAIRSSTVREVLRRGLDTELVRLQSRFEAAGDSPTDARENAAGVLASIIGCLVLGTLLPTATKGFAAPYVKRSVRRARG